MGDVELFNWLIAMLNAKALDKSAVTEWVLVYKQQCGSHGRKKSMRFAENEPSVGRDDTGKLTVRLQFKWIVPSLWRFYASEEAKLHDHLHGDALFSLVIAVCFVQASQLFPEYIAKVN